MLIMLDEIQKIFKEENLFDKLKENITFSFLEPKELKIKNPNELYIKMNSRGKPLNEFENFKSYFTSFLNSDNQIKFDNEWFDIFWNLKIKKDEKKAEEIEKIEEIIEKEIFKSYLNFFKNITAFYSENFNEVDIFKFDYKDIIEEITKTLDCLTTYDDKIIYDLRPYEDFKINIFKDFFKDSNKITYEERLRFYALMKFFIKVGEVKNNEVLFKQWIRVCLNLINNTLYNKIDDFYRIKDLLDQLIISLDNNFYDNLSKSNLSSTKQFKEEKLKADLIVKNSALEKEFIKAEKNWYLDGQIKFLIEFAGGKNNFNINQFIEYREKFIALWNFAKENKDNQILLYQTLLTKGNYLPKISSNLTFCSFEKGLREKNENWRKVFDSDKRKFLEDLLNNLNINHISNSLKQIKNEWLEKNQNIYCENENIDEKIFIYTLVKNKKNIEYCRKLQLRYQNSKEIYLLTKIQMNGEHSELYTYDLYTTNKLKEEWQYYTTNSWEQPCIYKILENNNCKYEINILWDIYKGFFVEIFEKEEEEEKNKECLNKLLSNIPFIKDNFKNEIIEGVYGHLSLRSNKYFNLCEMQDFIQFLETFLKEISKL